MKQEIINAKSNSNLETLKQLINQKNQQEIDEAELEEEYQQLSKAFAIQSKSSRIQTESSRQKKEEKKQIKQDNKRQEALDILKRSIHLYGKKNLDKILKGELSK